MGGYSYDFYKPLPKPKKPKTELPVTIEKAKTELAVTIERPKKGLFW